MAGWSPPDRRASCSAFVMPLPMRLSVRADRRETLAAPTAAKSQARLRRRDLRTATTPDQGVNGLF